MKSSFSSKKKTYDGQDFSCIVHRKLPVVPHKAVAEVSKIGNL